MKTLTPEEIETLQSEIKRLTAENKRLSDALTVIQTRQSRLLAYDWVTLENARQIGQNIGAIIMCAQGDITMTQMRKAVKPVAQRKFRIVSTKKTA